MVRQENLTSGVHGQGSFSSAIQIEKWWQNFWKVSCALTSGVFPTPFLFVAFWQKRNWNWILKFQGKKFLVASRIVAAPELTNSPKRCHFLAPCAYLVNNRTLKKNVTRILPWRLKGRVVVSVEYFEYAMKTRCYMCSLEHTIGISEQNKSWIRTVHLVGASSAWRPHTPELHWPTNSPNTQAIKDVC